jgi:glycosyltransferase involved in cell wall biosynthesis
MLESYQNAIMKGQPFEWALIGLFVLLFLFLVLYMIFFNLRVARHKATPGNLSTPLSILMVLRNEEDNLRDYLPGMLGLNNSEFEVVAVDNYSLDNSFIYLQSLQNQNQHLKISRLKQDTDFSEKMAQNIGLKAARYDWVMSVPPTTSTFGDDWISDISGHSSNTVDVVVSYSNIKPSGSFFNLLYRVECFFQQLKSFGFILNGMPYISSQENVAFKKDKYFGVGGYRGRITESFVQLEMVINSFLSKNNVALLISEKTAIQEKKKVSLKDYAELIKKERRLRKYLPAGIRFRLIVHEWVNFLFLPVAVAVVLLIPELWAFVLIMIIFLIFCNLFIIKKVLAGLNERKLFLPSFLIALFLPVIKFIFRALYGSYGRKKGWKKII